MLRIPAALLFALVAPAAAVSLQVNAAQLPSAASGQLSATAGAPLRAAAARPAQAPASGGLTLEDAIERAESNEPLFAAATAETRALALVRKDARATLLPSAIYHNQVLYDQPNGAPASRIGQTVDAPSPIFIADNAVREYVSQGVITERLGLAQVGAIRLADSNAARAGAELEIQRRGLVATVVRLYYSVGDAESRVAIAERALTEADHFVALTEKREAAREVAHADVLKARLQQQQRQRELVDARLAAAKARLELGVLLYPDPSTNFQLAPADPLPPLPERAGAEALAGAHNPELQSALAGVTVGSANLYAARAALLPELVLNFTYGIDATSFAVNGPEGIRNLGYSASATLDIPVWDWLTTERRIKETHLRAEATRVAVTAARRRLLADLAEFYAEAQAAEQQLASLGGSVADARESLRLTNLRYIAGESTALEVVDAQNSLSQAEVALSAGALRLRVARAQLETLTGRL